MFSLLFLSSYSSLYRFHPTHRFHRPMKFLHAWLGCRRPPLCGRLLPIINLSPDFTQLSCWPPSCIGSGSQLLTIATHPFAVPKGKRQADDEDEQDHYEPAHDENEPRLDRDCVSRHCLSLSPRAFDRHSRGRCRRSYGRRGSRAGSARSSSQVSSSRLTERSLLP